MAKATKICKVCGKEYPYCKTFRDDDMFRWQDVACCPEHGSEYFAQVLAVRAAKRAKTEPAAQKTEDGNAVESLDNDRKTSVEPKSVCDDAACDRDADWEEDDEDVFADDEEDEDEKPDYWYEEEFEE